MTTAARQAEADRVELVYYWALNQLGNAIAIDARELYAREVPKVPNRRSTSWLIEVIRLMFGFRSEAKDLAVAYYRLNRALRTGSTVRTGKESAGDTVSLEQLRQDFEDIVDHIDVETGEGDGTLPPRNLHVVDDEPILIEDIGDIDQMVADADEAARQEALDQLDQLGTENLLNDIDKGKDPEKAWETARDRGAAAAMRITMNAARGLVYDLADTDLRVQGWVRYHVPHDDTAPCGWCAMLMSRGLVYKTRAAASAAKNKDGNRIVGENGDVADADKYHLNCHCVAVPIFFVEQYDNPLFAPNREYRGLWDDLKKKSQAELEAIYGTSDLLAIFRKIMRQRQTQDTPAQAAA